MTSDQNCSARVEIQAVVQIHTDAESRLVDREEAAQPRTEERHHLPDSYSRTVTLPSVFEPSPAYRAAPGGQKRFLGENADAIEAASVAFVDLGELGDVVGMRTAVGRRRGARPARRARRAPRATLTTSRRRARSRCRASVRPSARNLARLLLQLDLSAIPHADSLPNICSYREEATTLRGSRGVAASASGGAAWRASSTRSGGCARG